MRNQEPVFYGSISRLLNYRVVLISGVLKTDFHSD